jgi:transposase
VILHAGHVRRFRDAAAFARFGGAAPIPCGSGQTADRHRLHRGGNRLLNAALYRIAIVQARHHVPAPRLPRAQDRRRQNTLEARRALKRHLANVIYRRLWTWAESTPALNT